MGVIVLCLTSFGTAGNGIAGCAGDGGNQFLVR
jgi:hypothetical protein